LDVGTALAPAIAFASDKNTGIYSPGADTLAFVEGGVEAMRIDSSGNVGIGTSSPGAGLQVTNGGVDTAHFGEGTAGAGINIKTRLTSLPTTGTTANIAWLDSGSGFSAGSLLLGSRPGVGNLVFSATGANDMIITPATGNVGIGTTSPSAILHTSASATGNTVGALLANTNQSGTADSVSLNFGLGRSIDSLVFSCPAITYLKEQQWTGTASTVDAALVFSTTLNETTSEKARIDSSGRLLVGTSSDSGGALLQVNGNRIRIATANTPASAGATGATGEIAWDADYIYVCTATNTWKRTAISTW
jgi:hypothetical protein